MTVNVNIWPRIGASVPVPTPDDPPLPAGGATVVYTEYIHQLLTSGHVLDRDPLNAGTDPAIDYTAQENWVHITRYRDLGVVAGEDCTDGIQACVDANKGYHIVIPQSALPFYYGGLTLEGSSYNGTKLIQRGGVLKMRPDAGSTNFGGAFVGLLIRDCSNITLDLRLDGNRENMSDDEHIYALGLAAPQHLNAKLSIREIRGDGVYLSQSDWLAESTQPANVNLDVEGYNSADDGRNLVSVIALSGGSIRCPFSTNIGAVVNGATMPGGIDLEPNYGYQVVENVTVEAGVVTTAGYGGVDVFGKGYDVSQPNKTGDALRDWCVKNVHVTCEKLIRTKSAVQAGIHFTRVKDSSIRVALESTNAYSQGFQVDYADRVDVNVAALHCSAAVVVGYDNSVRDSAIHLEVSDYTSVGLNVADVQRSKFTGRIYGASNAAAIAMYARAQGRAVTQDQVIYSVDCPYDGVQNLGWSNEPADPVAFTNCEMRDCSFGPQPGTTGAYPTYTRQFASGGAIPFRRNVQGVNYATNVATSGLWNAGERIQRINPAVSAGGTFIDSWVRITTGTGGVVPTDWATARVDHTSATVVANVANGATYTPDLSTGSTFLLTLQGATATIANPTNVVAGQRWSIIVVNGSGGATVITWGASYAFEGGSFAAPANTKRRAAELIYEGGPTNKVLVQSQADV